MSFWFSKEDIIYLHSTIVMKTGGEDKIRDEGMLESAHEPRFRHSIPLISIRQSLTSSPVFHSDQ